MLAYNTEPNGPWTQYPGNDHNNPTVTYLLRRLLENQTFKRDFINHFADLLNTTFHPQRVTNIINQMSTVLAPEIPEHLNRWRAPASVTEWRAHVQYLRDYAVNRPGFARQHLMQKFGLRGTVNVSIASANTNAGSVLLNSITLSAPANTPWKGIYFKDNPITATALPNPGFRFVGWDGIFGANSNKLTLFLNGDLSLVAKFEPAMDVTLSAQPLNGTTLKLTIKAAPSQIAMLEKSNNLTQWNAVETVTANAAGEAVVQRPFVGTGEFYRVRSD
jgi:hypothetical protein